MLKLFVASLWPKELVAPAIRLETDPARKKPTVVFAATLGWSQVGYVEFVIRFARFLYVTAGRKTAPLSLSSAALQDRAAQAERRIDQREMAQRLRKVTEHSLSMRVPFLRQEPDIVAQRQHPFEIGAGFAAAPLHIQAIGEPAGAGDKRAFRFAAR